MRRFGQVIGLQPGVYDEYVTAHAAVWPSVLERIAACNIRNYSIFAWGDDKLFAYFEYVGDDFDGDMAAMAADPETQRWWAWMMPLQAPVEGRGEGEWWHTMPEVFHTDGTPEG
ncbi:MAG: L-rhamnose mutarotase [Chloroflexota bacterium]